MSAGTKFKRLIPDEGPAAQDPAQVRRVIFCTGKVYYELAKERKRQKLETDIAIIRLEQVFIPSPLSEHVTLCEFWHFFCVFFHLFFISLLRSLHSHLTWSGQKRRNMPTLSWSGVRRSTRTWVTMITSGHVSSPCWPTRSLFGILSVHQFVSNQFWGLNNCHWWHIFIVPLRYVGRDPAAAPATGNKSTHLNELKRFMGTAFNLNAFWGKDL